MILYGAIFTIREVESLFTDAEKAEVLYNNINFIPSCEILKKLEKHDNRFTYVCNGGDLTKVYVYGISVTCIKDEEIFGSFKKTISDALSAVFKKLIRTSFYELKEDNYE